MEHKQHESSRITIYSSNNNYWSNLIQRAKAMAETKALATLLNLLGFTLTGVAFLAGLDAFQKALVWLVVVSFWMAKLYFYIVFSKQKRRRNELEMQKLEKDLK